VSSPQPPATADEPDELAGDAVDGGVLPDTGAEVPADWVRFAPSGDPYVLQRPPDWEVVIDSASATTNDLRAPDSATYLRLDWVDERRDPLGAWQDFEDDFAQRRAGYDRIRMVETTYKGNRAALWEYRYQADGVTMRAYNLGVNAGDYGFALNLVARDADWPRAQQLWPVFLTTYEFTGARG
jgi:hypothetical protein